MRGDDLMPFTTDGTNGSLMSCCLHSRHDNCYSCIHEVECDKFRAAYTASPAKIHRIRDAKLYAGADFFNEDWYKTELDEGLTIRKLIDLCNATGDCIECEAGINGNLACHFFRSDYCVWPSEIDSVLKVPKEVFEEDFLGKKVGT
jgi:hypothetical protein